MNAPSTSIAPLRAERTCRLVQWTPVDNNPSLIGRATVAFAGGWVVHRIPVFRKGDGSISVGAPDAADVDRDGQIRKKPDGKKSYHRIITFESSEAKARWDRMVLGALADAGVASPQPDEAMQ
jgi:hypothetical protein